MTAHIAGNPYVCARCLRAKSAFTTRVVPVHIRRYAETAASRKNQDDREQIENIEKQDRMEEDEGGMTRRLREMSEEALETGGRGAQKAVSEAEFSPELKAQLEERIAAASFRADNRNAFVEAELPSHTSKHTRDLATAEPWTGTESIHDASLRMLNDAHKPLQVRRGTPKLGPSARVPKKVDTGRRSGGGKATGTRLANARDRSGLYSSLKETDMDAQEREKRFQEFKERFSPNARSVVPGTIQGLTSLANERIEDAISRGQFKNIPRGKGVSTARDYNASNPFLDTTEYFMNKIIQKQEIVPPWIEKQQELVAAASKFRGRLRAEWTRHAARAIASKGGTLAQQIQRAEAYAKAEEIANPREKKKETINTVDKDGHVSQISLSGELKVPWESNGEQQISEEITAERITLDQPPSSEPSPTATTSSVSPADPTTTTSTESIEIPISPPPAPTTPTTTSSTPPAPHPFRDPTWETAESSYHTLAISDLNTKTRSYNLQAPQLAKKPCFSLERELNACYADVAPQLPEAIRQRAMKPTWKVEGFGQSLGGDRGVLDRFVGERVRVREERVERRYGFRQFWKDLWA